jgi:hypothetical protein
MLLLSMLLHNVAIAASLLGSTASQMQIGSPQPVSSRDSIYSNMSADTAAQFPDAQDPFEQSPSTEIPAATSQSAPLVIEQKPVNMATIIDQINKGDVLNFANKFVGTDLNATSCNDFISNLKQGIESKMKEHEDAAATCNLNGKEKALLASLNKALSEGDIDPKSSLGNKFRAENPAESVRGMTRTEIKAFRLEWGQKLKNKISAKSTRVKQWSRTDSTNFKMVTFGRLVVDLGGWNDPAAIKGALRGCMQCEVMGPPFVRTHPQTAMPIYAIAEISWSEDFKTSWTEASEYYTEQPGDRNLMITDPVDPKPETEPKAPGANPAANPNKRGTTDVNKPPAKKKGKGKGEPVTEADTSAPGSAAGGSPGSSPRATGVADADKKKLTTLVRDASKLKEKIEKSTAFADSLCRAIASGEGKHQWARDNASGDLRIQNALNALRSELTPWQEEMMLAPNLSEFRKKHSQAKIVIELTAFVNLTPQVENLSKVCDQIVKAGDIMSG